MREEARLSMPPPPPPSSGRKSRRHGRASGQPGKENAVNQVPVDAAVEPKKPGVQTVAGGKNSPTTTRTSQTGNDNPTEKEKKRTKKEEQQERRRLAKLEQERVRKFYEEIDNEPLEAFFEIS